MRTSLYRWRDENGATAAEFALVLAPFLALIFAIIGMGMVLWTDSTLQNAVEDAARCAAVKTNICKDAGTTQSYASSHYYGPASPTFTYSASGCGNTVSGTVTIPLDAVVVDLSLPLSASACFPQPAS